MHVTNNDTAAPIGLSPPRALENVEEARLRRIDEYGGARSAQTRAVPGRLARPSVRSGSREKADEETIRRWELLHARYLEYREGVPRLEEGMRKAAPEYRPDRRSMALVPEMEETAEKG